MDNDIPVCIIQITDSLVIKSYNSCFKKEIEKIINNPDLDSIIGRKIIEIIPNYKSDLYKEPSEIYIKNTKIKCSLSVSVNKNLIFIEIFHCTKRFLDFIGYEFRTPVSVAVEMASLLSSSDNPKSQTKYITAIKENNVRLTRLLMNTIDYLKLITHNIDFSRDMTSLDLIFNIIKSRMSKNKNITINYDILGNVKLYIDKQRFIEMVTHILNYFSNRMERGFINVKTSVVDRQLLIYFTDTGKKISSDDIFSGFIDKEYVLDSSSLELPISRGLALGMGGNLILENTTDYGSTFKFTIDL